MTSSDILPDARPTGAAPPRRPAVAAGVLALTAVLAVVVDLVVLAVARAAGADMVVVASGSAPHPVTTADVVGASAVPLLAVAWRPVLRVAQVVGGGFGVLSAAGPLLSESDGGTRAALAVMHVVVGVAVVVGLEVVRRRALPPR